MKNFIEIAVELTKMQIENAMGSKVNGNRNWTIKIEERNGFKIAYVGKFGAMKRRGFLSYERIADIIEKNIRWFSYTYKKDFQEAVNFLKEENFLVKEIG